MTGAGTGGGPVAGVTAGLARARRWTLASPVLAVFLAALAARLAVAVAVAVAAGGTLFLDDAGYVEVATALAEGRIGMDDTFVASVAVFIYPVAWLFAAFGVHPILGQLVAAAAGAGVATVTTRLALEALAPRWALAAGLVVAWLPSQVLWSSLVLKDALVWLGGAGVGLLIALAARRPDVAVDGRRLAVIGVAITVVVVALGWLRQYSMIVVAWALALSSWVGDRSPRRLLARVAGAVGILVAVPWLAATGPAGLDTITGGAGQLASIRAYGARGADTAVVEPAPTASPGQATPAPIAGGDEPAVVANLTHLPRGIRVMLIDPYPGQELATTGQRLALAEQVVWYPLLVFALIGLPAVARYRRVLVFPLLAGGALVVMYALAEGNFGTAYRHRGEFVWVVALFAAVGARRVTAHLTAGRRTTDR